MAIQVREFVNEDAVLVAAVQEGDAEAFSELFRRHYPSVRRACARRLLSVPDAEEVAQAAFVRAFERIHQCAGERRFGPWIHVIAQRLCVDTLRARQRVTPEGTTPDVERPVLTPGPEERLLVQERADHVHRALAALPPRQRQAVIARDLEERRPREIAAALGLSVGAFDSLLLRARRRLAGVYERVASEQGMTSTTAASASAASMAGGGALLAAPRAVLQAVDAVMAVARDTAYRVAAAVGLVPGASETAPRVASALAAVVAVATVAIPTNASPSADPMAPVEVTPPATAPITPSLGTGTATLTPTVAPPAAPAAPTAPVPTIGSPPAPNPPVVLTGPPAPPPPSGSVPPPPSATLAQLSAGTGPTVALPAVPTAPVTSPHVAVPTAAASTATVTSAVSSSSAVSSVSSAAASGASLPAPPAP